MDNIMQEVLKKITKSSRKNLGVVLTEVRPISEFIQEKSQGTCSLEEPIKS